MDEKQFKENYYLYEYYKEKIKELMNEKKEVDETLMKLRISLDALKFLANSEGTESMYVPVGSSAFLPVKMQSKNVLVGIGADTAIEVPPAEAQRILKDRMDRIEKLSRDYNQKIIDLRKEMDKLANELQEYATNNQ